MKIKCDDYLTLNEKVQTDFAKKGYTISDDDAMIISIFAQNVFNKPYKFQHGEIKEWNLIFTGTPSSNSVLIMSYCRGKFESISRIAFEPSLNKLTRTERFYG